MTKRTRTTGVVLTVLAVAGGAVTGIDATSGSTTTNAPSGPMGRAQGHDGRGGTDGRGLVHVEAVQLNRAGTAFITVTLDQGTVKSASGTTLTVHEGTAAVAYRDVAITLDPSAQVTLDGAAVTLSRLTTGVHVRVSKSSDGTTVDAWDANATKAWRGRGNDGDGRGPGGWDGRPPAPPTRTSAPATTLPAG